LAKTKAGFVVDWPVIW